VIGIAYDSEWIPEPFRFFKVALPDLSVSSMSADYWPAGWTGVRR
jgi:hypothetical protein